MELISREDAKSRGLGRYYTGQPCSRGHYSERWVGGTTCIECHNQRRDGVLGLRKIYSVGYNTVIRGVKGYAAKDEKGVFREYDHWRRMLQRSYDPKWKALHPTYGECSVATDWWNYQDFAEWFHSVEYRTDRSDLDKDLLYFGNKEYGSETCVFIPENINKGIVIRGAVSNWHSRDEYYQTSCNGVYIGRSANPLEYAEAWLDIKHSHIRKLAYTYKDILDPRAYDALLQFKVGVVDEKGTVARLS